jgi:hypothetical protein
VVSLGLSKKPDLGVIHIDVVETPEPPNKELGWVTLVEKNNQWDSCNWLYDKKNMELNLKLTANLGEEFVRLKSYYFYLSNGKIWEATEYFHDNYPSAKLSKWVN